VALKDHGNMQNFRDMVWLAKLSIASFQKWFPGATFMLFSNGDFNLLQEVFYSIPNPTLADVEIINQRSERFTNPYDFAPTGVWMKWVPFRFDVTKHEISIDTDIICIDKPQSWYDWLESNKTVMVSMERFEKTTVNTCGDFYQHSLLKDKKPFNCGILGQKAGCDFSERFYDICRSVEHGKTRDSLFITEQGAINLWARSLEQEGIALFEMSDTKNAWMRDFIYLMRSGVAVETVHAVSWHKKIIVHLKEIFEKRIYQAYNNDAFVLDILKKSLSFDSFSRHIIGRQFSGEMMNLEIVPA